MVVKVKCKDFSMWNWSPSILIGLTPKITFECGKCSNISKGRTNRMHSDDAYIQCRWCGAINVIPIEYGT